MSNNFITYEKENNRLLQELQNSKAYRDIVSLILERDATILAPYSQSYEVIKTPATPTKQGLSPVLAPPLPTKPIHFSMEFVQAHVVYFNKNNPHEFISLNGLRGVFSDKFDEVRILQGPPTSDDKIAFFNDPYCLFDKGYVTQSNIYILAYLQTRTRSPYFQHTCYEPVKFRFIPNMCDC